MSDGVGRWGGYILVLLVEAVVTDFYITGPWQFAASVLWPVKCDKLSTILG